MTPIIITKKDIAKIVGLSYPTVHQLEKDGQFPKRKQLTVKRVGWLYSELEDWAINLNTSASHN